jgi:hypothetical protein
LRYCARGKITINLRQLEYLQSQPGEDVDAAWQRLRPKLGYTGRQLDEVFLMEPSAVPSTGGSTPQTLTKLTGGDVGGSIGGVTTPSPFPTTGGGTTSGGGAPPGGGGIFGGVSDTGGKARIPLSNPATSPLNLIGKLEGWGIGPATTVSDVSIKVSTATGDQLKELLKKLPDGMTFELSLEKEGT